VSTSGFVGNKGDWSEIYAIFRVFADGHVWLGDPEMQPLENGHRTISAVLREESGVRICHRIEDGIVRSTTPTGGVVGESSREEFARVADQLLEAIAAHSGGTMSCTFAESLARRHGFAGLKAGSRMKADVFLELQDPRSGSTEFVGLSVKSELGSKPTLLNASGATNFDYVLEGPIEASMVRQLNEIEGKYRLRKRLLKLKESGIRLAFDGIGRNGGIFSLNLQVIDSRLPEICSEMLSLHYGTGISLMTEVVEALEAANTLGFDQIKGHRYYDYKVQQLLRDVALGMRPTQSVWYGQYEASAGYLVVQRDGTIIAYSLYNLNEFQEYLLRHTALETPDMSRYGNGLITRSGPEYLIKLPMQIRFV